MISKIVINGKIWKNLTSNVDKSDSYFLCHFLMYIGSQYVGYMKNIESKIELKTYEHIIQKWLHLQCFILSQTYLEQPYNEC